MKEIGRLTPELAALIGLKLNCSMPILLGDSNIAHMKNKHAKDYEKYKCLSDGI